ncbi:MAG: hypothetical protein ABIO70_11760 [Pseudomonadota bacterium]
MTFNLLWRDEQRAFIVADTAESGRSDGRFPLSSFNEVSSAGDGHPQEAAMKMVQVGTHGLAAASGDGTGARAMMDALYRLPPAALARGVAFALEEAARQVRTSSGAHVDAVTWVCAEWRDGALHTFAWQGAVRQDTIGCVTVIAGSPDEEIADGFAYITNRTCVELAEQRRGAAIVPADADLSIAVALVQAIVSAEGLMAYRGMGGAIVGGSVSAQGVRWQNDTVYLVVTEDFVEAASHAPLTALHLGAVSSGVVALAVREGCFFLRSSFTNGAKVLVPGNEKCRHPGWKRRWEEPLREPRFWLSAPVIGVINPVQRAVCLGFGDFSSRNELVTLELDVGTGELVAVIGNRLRQRLQETSKPGEPWRVAIEATAPYRLAGSEG